MKAKITSVLAAASLMALTGVASADNWDNYARQVVTVTNNSGYTINQIYMSATNDSHWESDLLGAHVLLSGYQTTIYADRGNYDVMLVDRDNDKCIVRGVTISGDRTLTVTRDMLMRCEGYR